MLSRHKPEPSRKIASFAEGIGARREGNQSRGDQWSYTWDCHQSARHLILFGTTADLSVKFGNLVVEADLRLDQDRQRCPGFFGQAA